MEPGHAAALSRDAIVAGATLIVAWGGDGTVNEVASVLSYGDIPLGIVPGGSGNGLARELGIPMSPNGALAVALQGRDVSIDTGAIDGQMFFNVAGVGFDALVASKVHSGRLRRRGFISYIRHSAASWFAYEPRRYEIRSESLALVARARLIALANSAQYGNGATIAPGAEVTDGLLDLVIVHAQSAAADLWRARKLWLGTLASDPVVQHERFEELTISSTEPISFHVDGEPRQGGETLIVKVHARALKVRTINDVS